MRIVRWLAIGYLILATIETVAYLIMKNDPADGFALVMHAAGAGLLWPVALFSYPFVILFCVWLGNSCT